jgi:hypothetical protein
MSTTLEYARKKTIGEWDVDAYKLALAIEEALPGKQFKINAVNEAVAVAFDDDLGSEDIAAVDAIVAQVGQEHPLNALKAARRAAINERTEAMIRVGYEFPPGSGQFLSMSDIAQFNLEVANGARNIPEFTYPVAFSFKDDTGSYACPDADTLNAMWLTALALKRAALDSGRALKDAINVAGTIEEVEAIVDDR